MCDWPVHSMKDTAAACVAELVEGRGRGMHSFLYIFVDTFIGGGLVIDSHLRNGLTGNAGAIGSMPLGLPDGHGAAPQLLSVASLHTLEQAWRDAGLPDPGFDGPEPLQAPWRDVTRAWLAAAAHARSRTRSTAPLPARPRRRDRRRRHPPQPARRADRRDRGGDAALATGKASTRRSCSPAPIGPDAGALGGALLPLHANFAPDRDLFIKEHG